MKKLIALAALLVAASACTTTTNTNEGAANTNANANANAAATATPAGVSQADLEAKERQVWDAIKAKNSDAFASFLASNAMEIEPENVYDKAASVKTVTQFDASKFVLSDFKEVKIDGDSTLLTYVVKGPGPDGKPLMMRHSTVWSNHGGKWQAYFHQGSIATK